MKTMKLIYPLAFAMAFTLATTGCHNHQVGKQTPLPGQVPPPVPNDNSGGSTLPPGTPINPDNNPNANGIPTTNPDEFEGMIKDPAALAAYTIHFAFDSATIKSGENRIWNPWPPR